MQGEKVKRKKTSTSGKASHGSGLEKTPSGVRGLDEITAGGLPRGRPTLVCGSAGCGKTLFALEFLIRGATEFGEPGVFMSFEESAADLAANVKSLGFDLPQLEAQKKLIVDYVHIQRSEIEETGDYDLEALFVRIDHSVKSIGAKRIAFDTLEALFGSIDGAVLRAEFRRLFSWLKDRRLTVVITGERGEKTLTRHGLEEYISDCVILLDHRVSDDVSTRRLRVVKYRGSTHGTNEYPFLIDQDGFSILPVTSMRLIHGAPSGRVSSGVERLDAMLDGKGYFRGSTILISGTAGTGKTSFVSSFARATCERGERCLYFAYEESVQQLTRNMRSIGIDLNGFIKKGLLRVESTRPFQYGFEMHLVLVHKMVREFNPSVVVIDPISNLAVSGSIVETRSLLTRVIDFFKNEGITTCFSSLTESDKADEPQENNEVGISSLIDTWCSLRSVESGGERNRIITVIKSRGMPHSNQTSEFVLGADGVRILDPYLGPEGVLTGAARQAQEAREQASLIDRPRDIERIRIALDGKRKAMEAQVLALQVQHEAESRAFEIEAANAVGVDLALLTERESMADKRWAFAKPAAGKVKPAAERRAR
jgi:circadian clock protein KaiC